MKRDEKALSITVTEKQLIERCAKYDREAQQLLYEKYAPKMLGICFRYVADRDTAYDIMHDAFITVFTKIGSFRHEGSFEGWMRRVFVTASLGYLRKRNNFKDSVQAETAAELTDGDPSALEKLEAKELNEHISSLPVGYRTVINLYAIEGYSHKEIAEMLNINEGTSRSQYLRGKAQLLKLVCTSIDEKDRY